MNPALDVVSQYVSERAAQASYFLVAHAVDLIAEAVAKLDAPVMLVKGAALARTMYPKPWLRPMSDVDVLVLERDRERVLAALEKTGFEVLAMPRDRRYSAHLLGETAVMLAAGALEVLVEVHHRLDKVVRRPIDYDAIAGRAIRLPDVVALSVPCPVDHALLVIMHAALSEFEHVVAWQDLELLLAAGIDGDALVHRAHAWELETATYAALARLRALGSERVPASLLERLAPRPWRRRAIDFLYPAPARRTGLRWVLAQAPLHDDLRTWLRGLARYAGARAVDRIGGG